MTAQASGGAAPHRPLVVLSDPSIHPDAVALLARDCTLRILDAYSPEDVFAQAASGASAILARLGTVTRRVIQAAPGLRIVARHGVGVDAVDLAAATAQGVVVTSTGSANAAAVAEYTFALLLALARKLPQADHAMRGGAWSREPLVGLELEGRVLGILGLGAIGERVARQALGFGMRVQAWRSGRAQRQVAGVAMVELPDLLATSDVLTLHLRLSAETAGCLDAAAIAALKPGALLVNTARGELVDEPALIRALAAGRLGGAALDTFAEEPLPGDSPLRRMHNVLLSPHVAGQTEAAVRRVGLAAAQAVLDELSGRRPANVHNAAAYAVRRERGLFAAPLIAG
ncbi:hydroxyacid dehydrogenase [Falsiroseomonas oryzae]|uniref:hydroxyacid dehydrogenase n=1 Tax=Falsiroseomonas oryzae TaxID=2766473 RepID=UPI0022EAF909|nr:hydroxyacid dehydrogenase [Roseomonas sp. MO-31]